VSFAALVSTDAAAEQASFDALRASYEYLTSFRDKHGGALRQFPDGLLQAVSVPYSFSDSERYWGEYVCKLPSADCRVEDLYDPRDFAVKPRPGPGAPLQTERVNVHNGTNIYDAATWQVAVMLGASINHFRNPLDADAYTLVSNQNAVLSGRYVAQDMPLGSRATTDAGRYIYGKQDIREPASAYAFRMTAARWLVDDPLKDTHYASLLTVGPLPANRSAYQPGRISWSDWRPITGDNAWAFFVGPLQAAFLHYVLERKLAYIPHDDPAIENALNVLPAFAALQSSVGAIYYAPRGTAATTADQAVNPFLVSIENNLSTYAGLRILQEALRRELSAERIDTATRSRITSARRLLAIMIDGGNLPTGVRTEGLLSFFRHFAWNGQEFVQGGYADDPSRAERWIPNNVPRAVDVTTWGIAAIRPEVIDGWYGFDTAYATWERLKKWGGYGADHHLAGVGYSDADGNGQGSDGAYQQGILSAEWTAGAIVMVRSLIAYYQAVRSDSPRYPQAGQYLKQLQADEAGMVDGLQSLRFDHYLSGEFPGKPPAYQDLAVTGKVAGSTQPYLYASKRYYIPFGWYANPLPSTCATAWALIVADRFDPFVYGGGLSVSVPVARSPTDRTKLAGASRSR
jgi:hypothetical protein